jgi:hydrogenase maturation factor
MLGEVARDGFLSSGGGQPGNVVLLAGEIPIEGASIIAREKRAGLLAHGFSNAEVDKAASFLHNPGISVVLPAQIAAQNGLVTAMHDPTEGGVATGLCELAIAAGVGIEIDLDAIPISPLAAKLCAAYNLNPLGTIASGALLATCAPENAEHLIAAWRQAGWSGAVIGRMTATAQGSPALKAWRAGQPVPFPTFPTDDITKQWT